MCGINGIFGLTDASQAEGKVVKMNLALAHRGPDNEGIFADSKLALGHKRLSIIDLSEAGKQPMTSNDGRFVISYNGELYNYLQLKSRMQEYSFKTNTDTEVVLAAYIKWGAACLAEFNGMFAFAIWDKEQKKLFIARDRLGIKPLYYYKKDEVFVFSSELRALLSSGLVPRKLDKNALVDYLRYQTVHSPATIIEGVSFLQAGHFLKVSDNSFQIEQYWNPAENTHQTNSDISYDAVCRETNRLLHESVERRLIADVPFGAFLSGGIDSSAVVGIMSSISDQKVSTFSVVFDEEEFSEAKYSDMIAKKFNTDHHQINLKISDFMDELPAALSALDHPSGDGPNTYLVSKVTKEAGITMALSGLGGDELFAGYDIFKRILSLESKKWLNVLPLVFRKTGGKILQLLKPGVSSDKIAELLQLASIEFASVYPYSRQVLLEEQIIQLLSDNSLPENAVAGYLKSQISNLKSNFPLLSQVSLAEMHTYMQHVLLRDTDQMSMAHALEVRVPLLDHELVEYVLGVPDNYKNPLTPKKLLVDALDGLLPDEVVNRPKMGFTFPWKNWLKNELRTFCEQKLNALSGRDYFKRKGIMKLWDGFMNDDPRITWSRIWILVVLENWLQENSIE